MSISPVAGGLIMKPVSVTRAANISLSYSVGCVACLYKAGAIIPMQPAMQWVDQHPVDVITLDVYPSGISSYEMYEDDGISMDYQKGLVH